MPMYTPEAKVSTDIDMAALLGAPGVCAKKKRRRSFGDILLTRRCCVSLSLAVTVGEQASTIGAQLGPDATIVLFVRNGA